MFPMVLPLPRTSISLAAGVACFLAHAGSAAMSSGLRVGGVPVKVMVPVTDEAAKATPGQTDNATSPVARRNLFPVPRMLGSLVVIPEWGDSTPGYAVRATPQAADHGEC